MPRLFACVVPNSWASAISGIPSPSRSRAAALIDRFSPVASTCRRQPGFSYQASSPMRVDKPMTSGRPSRFRSATTGW